jgi:hypothetical protein
MGTYLYCGRAYIVRLKIVLFSKNVIVMFSSPQKNQAQRMKF